MTAAAEYSRGLLERLSRIQIMRIAPIAESFLSANVTTRAHSFTELSEKGGHLFFDPRTGKGVFPYDTGCLEHGKYTIAVFGKTRAEVYVIYQNFLANASTNDHLA